MNAEPLRALFLHDAVSVKKLFSRQTIFRFLRRTDNFIAAPQRTRIVPEADSFRQTDLAVDKLNMGDIVQIQHRAHLFRLDIFLNGCFIGSEHDLFSGNAYFFAENQLSHRTAVPAESFFL